MAIYPVRVSIPSRRLPGNWPIKFVTEFRKQIEDYLNEQAKNKSVVTLSYGQIARGADVSKDIVEAFLMPLSGGHTGITISNPDLKDETDP